MIICNLEIMLEQKGISPDRLHEETDIPKATIRELLAQQAHSIHFDELEGLCDYLSCQVGDLLEHSSP